MAGILHGMQCHAIHIGGAIDHVHVLSIVSRTLALADLIKVPRALCRKHNIDYNDRYVWD